MADLQENLESLMLKAEEYLLIAKLAADRVVERRYEQLAEELRRRISGAVVGGSAESP
jgi:hypothetical protein